MSSLLVSVSHYNYYDYSGVVGRSRSYPPTSSNLHLTTSKSPSLLKNGKIRNISVKNNILPDLPQLPSPDNSDPGSWKVWLMGMIVSVIIPFWTNKWGRLQKIQKQVETVVDTAQEVTEMVEDMAKKVEKVADELGDRLPEGGKLKQTALFVEDFAQKTVHNADLIEDLLQKVEEVENKVEDFLEDQTNKKGEDKTDEK
ncbi:hypothetical protein CsatB_008489 [Cannabis sativa]|jgi:hypothetical protein|uniref:Uncharacterized protein n=2 Tax=Cannabis sativa TaxID=3483 RepID=A0AB40ECG1_CANSA|nr:uncharacterized protein LOC115699485 [Cannabis sativa]KAF4372931.1 hypothetical protein G4B88_018096 [Cannabis sativa]KAF4373139.1 hypothetical protein F8388_019321 [Cannabis sativa]